MKKLKIIIASILLLASISLVGCWEDNAVKVNLIDNPSNVFELDSTATKENNWNNNLCFSIKVVKGKEETNYVYGRKANKGETDLSELKEKYSIKDFDLSKTGSFTAEIDVENEKVNFNYSVVAATTNEAGFSSGKGTVEEPYIIRNAQQFLNLEKKINVTKQIDGTYKDKNDKSYNELYVTTSQTDFGNGEDINVVYNSVFADHSRVYSFQLGNDINFSSLADQVKNYNQNNNLINLVENVNIDGKGYKLYNIPETNSKNPYYFIYKCNASSFKNMNIYLNGNVKFIGKTTENGQYNLISSYKDINLYGDVNVDADVYSPFITYNDGELEIKNCNSYVNIEGNSAVVGTFIGNPFFDMFTSYSNKAIKFTDCNNYGTVKGNNASAFIGEVTLDARTAIEFNNCKNLSTITTKNSNSTMFIGYNDGGTVNDTSCENKGTIIVLD